MLKIWTLIAETALKIQFKSDEEIGKVAAAVPVLISRAIEMFMTRLLQDAEKQILQRNARTLTPQHIKQAINSHQVQFVLIKVRVSSANQKKYSTNIYGSWASKKFFDCKIIFSVWDSFTIWWLIYRTIIKIRMTMTWMNQNRKNEGSLMLPLPHPRKKSVNPKSFYI